MQKTNICKHQPGSFDTRRQKCRGFAEPLAAFAHEGTTDGNQQDGEGHWGACRPVHRLKLRLPNATSLTHIGRLGLPIPHEGKRRGEHCRKLLTASVSCILEVWISTIILGRGSAPTCNRYFNPCEMDGMHYIRLASCCFESAWALSRNPMKFRTLPASTAWPKRTAAVQKKKRGHSQSYDVINICVSVCVCVCTSYTYTCIERVRERERERVFPLSQPVLSWTPDLFSPRVKGFDLIWLRLPAKNQSRKLPKTEILAEGHHASSSINHKPS